MTEEINESLLGNVESSQPDNTGNAPSSQPDNTTQVQSTDGSDWYYDEGIPGKGEKPEWLDTSKYKSVVEAAKGVKGLRQKLGGFTGAPDKYSYEQPESIEHVQLNTEDPLYQKFEKFARQSNMSQEYFNECVNLYLGEENKYVQDEMGNKEKEMGKLGSNGEDRLNKVRNWITSNIPEKYHNTLASMVVNAEQIEVLEFLQQKTFDSSMPSKGTDNGSLRPAMELNEIYQIMRGEGDLGKRYQRDQSFQEEIRNILMRRTNKN